MAHAASVGREDLPRCPIKLGTIEHLIGAFPFQVAHQDDGQKSVLSRLVVQGLDRLDRQGGMEPELVELEFRPGSVGSSAHCFMPGNLSPFLRAGPLRFSFLGDAGS